jgi:hypothetical protein
VSRIEVDYADLELAARRLGGSVQVAQEVHRHARRLSGSVADCGHGGLVATAEDFLDRWAHGAGVLAEDGQALARLLGEAAAQYRALDEGIAGAAGGR